MIKKLLKIISASVLTAGVIFLLCAFSVTVAQGVTVNGVSVGGMTLKAAAEEIRRGIEEDLKDKTLTVKGREDVYTFTYPEINFKDDVFQLLKGAKRGQKLSPKVSYYLCGESDVITGICASEQISVVEPYAVFNLAGEPFTYREGRDGSEVDVSKLRNDIKLSLDGSFKPVEIVFKEVKRSRSLDDVKAETCKLASFTTYFDGDNLSRVSNIRLAASKINGSVLQRGETLSFNGTVGERLKSRGFLNAKIIENGEFKDGIGGGVCQVSTTLYNCALLAGFEIEEYHPHSLAVGYVPPSRDAMVSGTTCDLKIKNTCDSPAYVRAKTGNNYVTFEIYGLKGEAEYSISSEVTGEIKAEEELTNDPSKARDGKNGLTSAGYLTVIRDGYKKRVLLRKDKYLPVKGLKYVGDDIETAEEEAPN